MKIIQSAKASTWKIMAAIAVHIAATASCGAGVVFYDSEAAWQAAAAGRYSVSTLSIRNAGVTDDDPIGISFNQGYLTLAHNYLSTGVTTASQTVGNITSGPEARNGFKLFPFYGTFDPYFLYYRAVGFWVDTDSADWVAGLTGGHYPDTNDPGSVVPGGQYKSLGAGFVGWVVDEGDYQQFSVHFFNSSYSTTSDNLVIERVDYAVAPIPEPSGVAAVAVASFLFLLRRRNLV